MSSSEPQPLIDGTMPNVVGLTLATAEERITAAAQDGSPDYSVSYVPGGTPGTVKSTTPEAGKQITDTVRIVVYSFEPK